MKLTRRQIIKALAALAIPAAVLSAIGVAPKAEAAMLLPATPELEDADDPTPPLTEGPFYKPKSPRRSQISSNQACKGEKVIVSGKVTDRKGESCCQRPEWKSGTPTPRASTTTWDIAVVDTSSPRRMEPTSSPPFFPGSIRAARGTITFECRLQASLLSPRNSSSQASQGIRATGSSCANWS